MYTSKFTGQLPTEFGRLVKLQSGFDLYTNQVKLLLFGPAHCWCICVRVKKFNWYLPDQCSATGEARTALELYSCSGGAGSALRLGVVAGLGRARVDLAERAAGP